MTYYNWPIRTIARVQYHQLTWYNSLWLWRWLLHRLSKHQSLSTTTVLFRTTFTPTITLDLLLNRMDVYKFFGIPYLTGGFFFGFMHLCSVLRVKVKWLSFCVGLLWYHVHTQCSIAFKDFMIQFSCFELVTVKSKKILQSQNWLRLMGLDKL